MPAAAASASRSTRVSERPWEAAGAAQAALFCGRGKFGVKPLLQVALPGRACHRAGCSEKKEPARGGLQGAAEVSLQKPIMPPSFLVMTMVAERGRAVLVAGGAVVALLPSGHLLT